MVGCSLEVTFVLLELFSLIERLRTGMKRPFRDLQSHTLQFLCLTFSLILPAQLDSPDQKLCHAPPDTWNALLALTLYTVVDCAV